MKELKITRNEAGQRLDKLLGKYLKEAPQGFLYKMLRKKNITLNGKKADGSQLLREGDSVKLFLSLETLAKFSGIPIEELEREAKEPEKEGEEKAASQKEEKKAEKRAGEKPPFSIVYEDENILVANKPVGLLSQKAAKEDVSFVEYLKEYMLNENLITKEQLRTFQPGICNRLDRNTSGLLIAGKSLAGLQEMNRLFKERKLEKYYLCIVKGKINGRKKIDGYLTKETSHNRVSITKEETEGSSYIQTEYMPLSACQWKEKEFTLLKVHLITGKSHQIRAHLKSIGHPIIGDGKYGHKDISYIVKKEFNLRNQLLHAYELQLGEVGGSLSYLSGKRFIAPLPEQFIQIIKGMRLNSSEIVIEDNL